MKWGTTELGLEPTMEVGLDENPSGIPFQCGTCEYFHEGICHNEHPKLHGKYVEALWCCNRYDREGMKVIVGG